MRSMALACWLACAFASGGSSQASGGWDVVVRPFKADTAQRVRLYWVGLRNSASQPRAFCLLGVRYSYDLVDGSSVDQPTIEYPSVGSPHHCAATIGHLVLPGETHFVKVQVSLPGDAKIRGAVRFRVTAEETCTEGDSCEHGPILASEAKPDGR